MRVIFDRSVADVAEQEFAVDAVHFVFSSLFRIDGFTGRALDTPLYVDVGVSL